MPQVLVGQGVEAVGAGTGVEQVIAHHRVDAEAGERHARPAEDEHVVLDVLVNDFGVGIFEERLELFEDAVRVERSLPGRSADGQVVTLPRLPTEGPADDVGLDGVEARRLQVDAVLFLLPEFVKKSLERLVGVDEFVIAAGRRLEGGDR